MNASEITQGLAASIIPNRPSDGHKGTFGHVFIIAGSRGYSGAAVLAGLGALRSGTGLVTIGTPESLGEMSDKGLPEVMTFPLLETHEHTVTIAALEGAYEFSSNMDAVVIGPGLSQHTKTREFILTFIEECSVPLVIDADGLNALQDHTDILAKRNAPTILTPHPGEMSRLTGLPTKEIQANREDIAIDHAKKWGCTVVLKGEGTIIANEAGECHINTTGNPGMATGGSGDVLSGLMGGLLAQGLNPFDAATLSAYLHGLAGDLAALALTEYGMTAGDIADHLPEAWQHILDESCPMEIVGDIGEFGFIDRITPHLTTNGNVLVGPGDDCAVIKSGDRTLLVTCDASLEDIHFDKSHATPEEIGWKAAAGAISDIAAMGGIPQNMVITLGAPSATPVADLKAIYKGMSNVASRFDIALIGGDTVRSPNGLLLDITVLGEAPNGKYILRSGAQPGDMLIVTGTPGRSAAGRLARENNQEFPVLSEAHYHPLPRIAEGQWLNQREEVHALIDVSDGVVQDAGHIANASGIGIAFTSASVAIDPVLVDFCIMRGESIQDYVFYGGEDYELAFAVAPDKCDKLLHEFREQFDIPAFILGEFSDKFSGTLVDDNPPEASGWDHFKKSDSTD